MSCDVELERHERGPMTARRLLRDVTPGTGAALFAVDDESARYRGLLEAAPDAMLVVNELGQIILLNLQAEKCFGYRRDELVGRPVTNVIPDGFAERDKYSILLRRAHC